MKFVIRNQAKISNKYLRFAKWKIRALSKKFKSLEYSEIFVKSEGNSPRVYSTTIRLGVPGHDIILKGQSEDLNQLWSMMSQKIKTQLRKNK